MIGKCIDGRYHIQKLLGEGGFGSVYRAHDQRLDREIAIKILNLDLKTNPDQVERFLQEARITSKLEHPNVLRLYDFGQTSEGKPFIVSELLDGSSLETVLQCYSLSIPQTFYVLKHVTLALQEAHRNNITHRDVKPPNIFVHNAGSREEIKLLDFGVAKVGGEDSHTTGQLFGTPYYMSPEQIYGKSELTEAADIYSLGVLAYHCLTGWIPFDGESQYEIFEKHIHNDVPQLALHSSLLDQPQLQNLVETMMAKDPLDRPQNASDILKALEGLERLRPQWFIEPQSLLQPQVPLNRGNTRSFHIGHLQTDTLISSSISDLLSNSREQEEAIDIIPPFMLSTEINTDTVVYNQTYEDTKLTLDPHKRDTFNLSSQDVLDALQDESQIITSENINQNKSIEINHTHEGPTQLRSLLDPQITLPADPALHAKWNGSQNTVVHRQRHTDPTGYTRHRSSQSSHFNKSKATRLIFALSIVVILITLAMIQNNEHKKHIENPTHVNTPNDINTQSAQNQLRSPSTFNHNTGDHISKELPLPIEAIDDDSFHFKEEDIVLPDAIVDTIKTSKKSPHSKRTHTKHSKKKSNTTAKDTIKTKSAQRSKKATGKKATGKKATGKKATVKKATGKKATVKKATGKKATVKKATKRKKTPKNRKNNSRTTKKASTKSKNKSSHKKTMIHRVTLSIILPKGSSSFYPSQPIPLKSNAYTKTNEKVAEQIQFTVMNASKKALRTTPQKVIKLKAGEWFVKACVHKVCSRPKRVIVFDPTHIP